MRKDDMKLVLKEEYTIRQSGTGRAIGLPPLWQMDLLPGTPLKIFEDADTGDLLIQNPDRDMNKKTE
jgi:hypothetical protein